MDLQQRTAAIVACSATATAICISALAGWQRGGWTIERALWVMIGVVIVIAAHLLPALCMRAAVALRLLGGILWICCLASVCYGHATFFLMAQQHAGESRAATVATPRAPAAPTGRSLTEIAAERATTESRLAAVTRTRCTGDCATQVARRVTLTARLDALDAEAGDARRRNAAVDRLMEQEDRAEQRRDALRMDPVTARVAAATGAPAGRIELLSGLAFAAVLEGVACVAWLLAMQPGEVAVATVAAVAEPEAAEPMPVALNVEPTSRDYAEIEQDDVARVAAAIAAGTLRGTTVAIREFLGCSQARALAVRRLVVGSAGEATT